MLDTCFEGLRFLRSLIRLLADLIGRNDM